MQTSEAGSIPETLTRRQVAERLGVHVDTVRRWEDRGALTPLRTPGGHVRYAADEVAALLERGDAA